MIIVERGTLLKVLDHGYVRLIDFMGNDEGIVEAARMSTDKGFISWDPYSRCDACGDRIFGIGQEGHLSSLGCKKHKMVAYPNGDLGLLDNLWRKKHATPFEMGDLIIEVQAPLMVFREWQRSRTQSYNEFSARYSVMPDLHYVPALERLKPKTGNNKQETSSVWPVVGETNFEEFLGHIKNDQGAVYETYTDMLQAGVPKEVARINTPVSRYSKMRAKGNLRNWFQFLNLRMRPDAQYEIRQYAEAVGNIISWLWPKAYSLFEEYDLYGASFSRTELRILRGMLGGLNGEGHLEKSFLIQGLTGTKLKEFMEKLEAGGDKILA